MVTEIVKIAFIHFTCIRVYVHAYVRLAADVQQLIIEHGEIIWSFVACGHLLSIHNPGSVNAVDGQMDEKTFFSLLVSESLIYDNTYERLIR